ncbi:glycosyltransferase [Desulfosediminicola sp.]|uniref:glycosyltransferase n=1 Tax=Desulfosediminicola sp. TaxID=2886825 RepID=UPI003AF25551
MLDSGGMYGAENVVINLSREMMTTGCYRPIVGCIVPKAGTKVDLHIAAQRNGLDSHIYTINNYLLFRDLPRFARSLKKHKIDLIHSHGYKASVFAFCAKLLNGIPVIATCHLWFADTKQPLKKRLMIALEKLIYRTFPIIVAVSEDIKRMLVDSGVNERQIRIVHNGIVLSDHVTLPFSDKQRLKEQLGLGEKDICVFNVGRLTAQKGQDSLIYAAGYVKGINTQVKFYIAGEGTLRESLQEKINTLELGDTVHLLGFRDDIPNLLQVADLFVLPSLDEGMPIALLEAVANRVPVLTTAVGDIPKLIVADKTGIILSSNEPVSLGKEILTILDDHQKQQALVEQAWDRFISSFSSQTMSKHYHYLYRSIIN